jgi:hypothetical protein
LPAGGGGLGGQHAWLEDVERKVALAGSIAFGLGLAVGAGGASAEPLPLPPGEIVKGTVFKQPFQCPPDFVPQIENGADANAYICGSPPTLSFVPHAPAATVVTSEPMQYVRVYCPECTPPSVPNRSFMAEPSIIRGMTPEEIRDVLALPAVPSMITIVTVPVGTCVLTELAYLLPAGFAAPLMISGRIGRAQEFGDTERTASAFFDGTPSAATFTVTGAPVPGNAVVERGSRLPRPASICLPAMMAQRETAGACTVEARDCASFSDRHMATRHRLR